MTVEEAAAAIRQEVDAFIAGYLQELVAGCGEGRRPQALFAYGGAGPTHCCGYSAGLPVERIVTSPYSPVFSAFGLGNMDITHKYSLSREILLNGGSNEEKAALINTSLEKLKAVAYRDMRGEGFRPEDIAFNIELFVSALEGAGEERVLLPSDILSSSHLYDLSKKFSLLSSVVLNAVVTIPHQNIPRVTLEGSDPFRARTGERQVFWPGENKFLDTGVYRRELLRPGNVIAGPAVIEAVDTTCIVPAGRRYTVDEYMNGIIEGVE